MVLYGVTNILGSYASANIVKGFQKPVLKSIVFQRQQIIVASYHHYCLCYTSDTHNGSEVLIYYIMLEDGFVFNADNTVNHLKDIIYIIFCTVFCLWLSWYGFNLLGKIAYYYKTYRNIANILLFSIISIASISIFAIHEWMIICIFVLSIIGFLIRRWDTSPIIYGYFLSDLFYENLIRTLIIL